MRRGGGKPVELRQVLLAGEHQLRRGERLGQLARLLGDPPSIDAGEGGAEQDRGPDTGDIEERQFDAPVGEPGQRAMDQGEQGRETDGEEPEGKGAVGGRAVAEISTGARNRREKGFCSPPVRNRSAAS